MSLQTRQEQKTQKKQYPKMLKLQHCRIAFWNDKSLRYNMTCPQTIERQLPFTRRAGLFLIAVSFRTSILDVVVKRFLRFCRPRAFHCGQFPKNYRFLPL